MSRKAMMPTRPSPPPPIARPPPPMPRRSRTCPGSSVAPLRNRTAGRFRRSVQSKHEALLVLADAYEAAFLEHADGAGVLAGDVGHQRPLRDLFDSRPQRCGRDPFPPVLAADPVADQPAFVALPAHDVPDHRPVRLDRAHVVGRIGADLLPVREVRLALARRKGGHRDRFGIALVLVEDRDVVVGDFADGYRQTLVASLAAERFGELSNSVGMA